MSLSGCCPDFPRAITAISISNTIQYIGFNAQNQYLYRKHGQNFYIPPVFSIITSYKY